ncbi:hypothetical protein JVT61DRAFT_6189 [Boletus reticuloceps]|uniref:F-box domain-containing protein n=1 Tax=Boletus reticuloceps TaxID=495285 RepID=A0A8I3A6Q8_9AGAM|nr:hypothetical protein JVT61DRAFT_6189 [Boletus reticuloceps]
MAPFIIPLSNLAFALPSSVLSTYHNYQIMVSVTRKRVIYSPTIAPHILICLSPRDIIRLRLVSKFFNGVTRDRRLWCLLYARACLPRPPGPFEWQPLSFHERALINSARTSLTWTLRPTLDGLALIQGPRLTPRGVLKIQPWRFLLGRLLVWCEESSIFAHDIDTATRMVVWTNLTPIPCSSIEAASLNHQDGERVYIAFGDAVENKRRLLIRLLEVPVRRDATPLLGPVSRGMHLPQGTSFSMNASFPFLSFGNGLERACGQSLPLLIDMRTWATYTFPPYHSSLEGPVSRKPDHWVDNFIALSRTHILVTRELTFPDAPRMTHIQAFVLPPPPRRSTSSVNKLRLSHEILTSRIPPPTRVLRDSVIDPVTGNVHIRFLGMLRFDLMSMAQYSCIDTILPPVVPNLVYQPILPIDIHDQPLFYARGRLRRLELQSSKQGHVRGLLMSRYLYRFSIDASKEDCIAMLSEPEIRSADDPLETTRYLGFDGVRGRICYEVETGDVRDRDLMVSEFR